MIFNVCEICLLRIRNISFKTRLCVNRAMSQHFVITDMMWFIMELIFLNFQFLMERLYIIEDILNINFDIQQFISKEKQKKR